MLGQERMAKTSQTPSDTPIRLSGQRIPGHGYMAVPWHLPCIYTLLDGFDDLVGDALVDIKPFLFEVQRFT